MPKKANSAEKDLENALIISLIIGIIIVSVTLVIARPSPETFTELYFEDHQSLPTIIGENEYCNFTFTISNHEGKKAEYNYSITTELYNYDYTCRANSLYLEEGDTGILSMFITKPHNITSRKTYPRDPALYITDTSYELHGRYRMMDGAGILAISFEKEIGPDAYTIVIDESAQKAHLITFSGQNIIVNTKDAPQGARQSHSFDIFASATSIKFYIDGQKIFAEGPIEGYTGGHITFTSEQTHASLTGVSIRRKEREYPVSVRFDEEETVKAQLEHFDGIEENRYVSYQSGFVDRMLSDVDYYAPKDPLNMTSATFEVQFGATTGTAISIGFIGLVEVAYDDSDKQAFSAASAAEGMVIKKAAAMQAQRPWRALSIDISEDTIITYIDNKKISENKMTRPASELHPFIRTYDHKGPHPIRNAKVKDNKRPYAVTLAPREEEQPDNIRTVSATDIALLKLAQSKSLNQTKVQKDPMFLDLLDKQKITWQNYTIVANYVDPSKSQKASIMLTDLISTPLKVTIDNSIDIITISYEKDGKAQNKEFEGRLLQKLYHRITADINSTSASIRVDGVPITTVEPDTLTGLALLMDSGDDIRWAQVEVRDKGSEDRRILSTADPACDPILLRSESYNSTITVKDEKKMTLSSAASFEGAFDIARVKVSLQTGQDIHFWVRRR